MENYRQPAFPYMYAVGNCIVSRDPNQRPTLEEQMEQINRSLPLCENLHVEELFNIHTELEKLLNSRCHNWRSIPVGNYHPIPWKSQVLHYRQLLRNMDGKY